MNKESIQTFLLKPMTSIVAWITFGILSILVPIIHYTVQNRRHWMYYGQYQEQDQNQGNQNNQNYNYYNCYWFQFRCKVKKYYYSENNSGDNGVYLPNWWIATFGEAEEDRRQREESGASSGVEKFVYAWSLIVFVALLAFGVWALRAKNKTQATSTGLLLMTLVVFLNMSLIS